jgi:predicted phage-related endonuclease
MLDNIQRYNLYVQKLQNLDSEYYQKIKDLENTSNKFDKLFPRKLSRELDEIKDDYKGYLFGLVLSYNLEFKVDVYEDVYTERVKTFTKLCNKTFDELYEKFEKVNGLL